MKVRFRRDQQKSGVFGLGKGFDFILKAQIEFTQEESELIKKYAVGDYIIGSLKYSPFIR